MTRFLPLFLAILSFMFLATPSHAAVTETCDVSSITNAQWLTPDPAKQLAAVPVKGVFQNPTTKVANSSTNCDFHIFSWQWFTYLMNPVASPGTGRNFENRAIYPTVDLDTCASVKAGGALFQAAHRGLSPSVLKVVDMPDIPGQAGPGDALYDRNTNIVFYNRSFTANECGIYNTGNFPDAGGTSTTFPTGFNQVVEIKTSWRIMGPGDDTSKYYRISADIEGVGTKTLGLVGMHIVVNTKGHPEFVWATFEHLDNAPNCVVANAATSTTEFFRPQPTAGWSFAGSSCNTCISTNYTDGTDLRTKCTSSCTFNKNASKPVLDSQGNVLVNGPTGTKPSDICLDTHYGTAGTLPSGDDVNIPNIQYLNTLLVGPKGIITGLDSSNALSVLKNYYLGGAVWTNMAKITSKTEKFSKAITGSIELANSTLESFTQLGNGFNGGCFSCHGGASLSNTAFASHLLTGQAGGPPGLIERCNVKAGPIYSQSQAETVCPQVCANGMGWNGNWTTIASAQSVCGCNACTTGQ